MNDAVDVINPVEAAPKSLLFPVLFGTAAFLIGLWRACLEAGLSEENMGRFVSLAWEYGVISELLAEALGLSVAIPLIIILVMSCFKRLRATSSRRIAFMVWSAVISIANGIAISTLL